MKRLKQKHTGKDFISLDSKSVQSMITEAVYYSRLQENILEGFVVEKSNFKIYMLCIIECTMIFHYLIS